MSLGQFKKYKNFMIVKSRKIYLLVKCTNNYEHLFVKIWLKMLIYFFKKKEQKLGQIGRVGL